MWICGYVHIGIDPSGRIPHEHFDDSEDESDDDDSSTQSPRYGTTFLDCNISPTEGDKTFGDFSTPAHLRAFRNKHSVSLFFLVYSTLEIAGNWF